MNMGGRESSIYVWAGIACQAIAVLFTCLSLGSSSWVWGTIGDYQINLGLWMGCMDGLCVKLTEADALLQHEIGDWIVLSQVTGCMGFSLFVLGLLALVFCHICGTYRNNPTCLLLTAAIAPIAAALYGFALFLYMFNTHYAQMHYGYSTYLGLTGLWSGLMAAIALTREHSHQMRPASGYIRLN